MEMTANVELTKEKNLMELLDLLRKNNMKVFLIPRNSATLFKAAFPFCFAAVTISPAFALISALSSTDDRGFMKASGEPLPFR